MLGLDSERIPRNYAATQFAEALGKAWAEYNNDRYTLALCSLCLFYQDCLENASTTNIFFPRGCPVL